MSLGLFQAMVINGDASTTTYEFKSYGMMKTFIKRHAHLKPIQLRRKRSLPNHQLFNEFVPIEKNINRALNRGEQV